GDATEKGAGQKHRAKHQSDGQDGAGYLVHGLDGRFSNRQALVEPALDVFQHHNRVVDDDADGQHQTKQGQVVQTESHQLHYGESTDQRHGDVDQRKDQRLPVLKEEKDHDGN